MSYTFRIDQTDGAGQGTVGVARKDLWLGKEVTLTADTENLTYEWALLYRPVGSTATLDATDAVIAHFTPDVWGTYRVQLQMNGGSAGTVRLLCATTRNSAGSEINRGWRLFANQEQPEEANFEGNTLGLQPDWEKILTDLAVGGGSGNATSIQGVVVAVPDPDNVPTIAAYGGSEVGIAWATRTQLFSSGFPEVTEQTLASYRFTDAETPILDESDTHADLTQDGSVDTRSSGLHLSGQQKCVFLLADSAASGLYTTQTLPDELSSNNLTLHALIRMSARTVNGEPGATFASFTDGTSDNAFVLDYVEAGTLLRATMWVAGTPITASVGISEVPTAGSWLYLAAVWDQEAHSVSLFINGVLTASASGSDDRPSLTEIGVGTFSASTETPVRYNPFRGWVGWVRLEAAARSGAEIHDLFIQLLQL